MFVECFAILLTLPSYRNTPQGHFDMKSWWKDPDPWASPCLEPHRSVRLPTSKLAACILINHVWRRLYLHFNKRKIPGSCLNMNSPHELAIQIWFRINVCSLENKWRLKWLRIMTFKLQVRYEKRMTKYNSLFFIVYVVCKSICVVRQKHANQLYDGEGEIERKRVR